MQRKVEPPGLDPAEEPLLWEGLTLNKCILVASVVALLSVTFQVLQGEPDGGGRGGQTLLPPPATSCHLSPSLLQRRAPEMESARAGRTLRHLPCTVGSDAPGCPDSPNPA